MQVSFQLKNKKNLKYNHGSRAKLLLSQDGSHNRQTQITRDCLTPAENHFRPSQPGCETRRLRQSDEN